MAEELSWVRWITALFVVAIAMAGSFWGLRRMQASSGTWLPIRVTSRVRLGRSTELILVEIENERFLLGSTPASITTIAKWPPDTPGSTALD